MLRSRPAMYVVIAGAGHMGLHLVTRLLAEGHEAVVVEAEPLVAQRIFAEQGVVAITGSATDLDTLEQAGLKRADAAVAMTGRDADNLVFCLLARHFGVSRVLARMLNPRYETAYRLVGATRIHSEADLLVDSFLNSIEYPQIGAIMRVGRGDLVAFDLRIPAGSPVAGHPIAEIVGRPDFPARCVFVGVESRSGEVEVPHGNTVIEGGTTVMLAAHRPDLPQLLATLTAGGHLKLTAEQRESLQTLRLVPFLAGVSQDDLEQLSLGARIERRRAGDVIFALGQPGDRFYVLRRGAVELQARGGPPRVVKSPACFGEMSALTGEPRTQSARVAEESELLSIDSATFRSVLLQNPFLALELAKALSDSDPTSDRSI